MVAMAEGTAEEETVEVEGVDNNDNDLFLIPSIM